MTRDDGDRSTESGWRTCRRAVIGAMLVAFSSVSLVQAMWARMSDAELIKKSPWIVVGEWIGQGPVRMSEGAVTSELAVIVVHEVLQGPTGVSLAFVSVPGASQPISSSDLRFKRGDRGVWFLRARVDGDNGGPFVVDHPQRFLRDSPENAATIAKLRQQLRR